MYYKVADMPRAIGSRIWPTLIAPRPVLLVVTQSESGVPNIAPFNSISCVSSYPPVVSLSFGMRHGAPKITQENIAATEWFSLNLVSPELAGIANSAATGTDRQDDFARLKLTVRHFEDAATIGIAESPASIACKVTQTVQVDGTQCTLVFAKCIDVIINDHLVKDGLLDTIESNLIASIGVEDYISVKGDTFSLPRLWE